MYTILIVDDEKIERNGIKFLLKKQAEPFEIYEAPNGKAALEQLCSMRNQGKKIDILLTDVKMPFMDGIELIGAAKEEGFTLKTIIFSGYNEFEYAKLAVRLGVSDYILKPVNPQEFAQTIEKVTGELQKQYVENEQRLQQSSYMREYLLYTLFNGGGAEQVHTLAGNLAGENFWNHFHRIVFLEFDREFFGKKALDFQAEILEENMSEEYQYLNLNPVSCWRHLERILQIGRATVVCAWRRNDIYLRRRVCRLDVVHHRRGKAFGLRRLRCLYHTVDHVCEVGGL